IVNGDCWRSGTNLMCRTAWTGQNTILNMRLIDQFSQYDPQWSTAAHNAADNWTNASGPQLFRWSSFAGDSWDYLKFCTNDTAPCFPGVYGLTKNCDRVNYCDNTGT